MSAKIYLLCFPALDLQAPVATPQLFTWAVERSTHVFMLVQQVYYQLSHCPTLRVCFSQ